MLDGRLSGLDVAFLCLEGERTPMHMGAVVTFEPGGPVDTERLTLLLAARAARIPQLRKHIRHTLLPPGGAVWVDDPGFDPARHLGVHHVSSLYEPDPLAAFASLWIAEPLDMSRPLWDLRLVTGLPGGRFAVLLKLHHALADGAGAFTIGSGLLDELPGARAVRATSPKPVGAKPARGALSLLKDGVSTVFTQAAEGASIASSMLRAARPYPASPISAPDADERSLGFVRLDLADLRRVRRAHGGTTNDVLLAIVAGALRDWLINRGHRADDRTLRALIPVSVRARHQGSTDGNQLSGYLCDLPIGLTDPVARLRAVRRSMSHAKAQGTATGPGAFGVLANRLPAPVHRLATRAAGRAAPLLFDTVVTNVPMPGGPLTLDGARLREIYPLVPLPPHQALGIAISVYRDSVHIGLQANGEAVADLGSLRDAFAKSTATLADTCA
ncbi:wax ester/triacylglycerol synthase family O-acyltransferase [Saccharothrix sp. AJ9571]|nr:wax ester/triacylglycerol synthase family O-acyltransferase [Saccharothrix sp. AJ9571]